MGAEAQDGAAAGTGQSAGHSEHLVPQVVGRGRQEVGTVAELLGPAGQALSQLLPEEPDLVRPEAVAGEVALAQSLASSIWSSTRAWSRWRASR